MTRKMRKEFSPEVVELKKEKWEFKTLSFDCRFAEGKAHVLLCVMAAGGFAEAHTTIPNEYTKWMEIYIPFPLFIWAYTPNPHFDFWERKRVLSEKLATSTVEERERDRERARAPECRVVGRCLLFVRVCWWPLLHHRKNWPPTWPCAQTVLVWLKSSGTLQFLGAPTALLLWSLKLYKYCELMSDEPTSSAGYATSSSTAVHTPTSRARPTSSTMLPIVGTSGGNTTPTITGLGRRAGVTFSPSFSSPSNVRAITDAFWL